MDILQAAIDDSSCSPAFLEALLASGMFNCGCHGDVGCMGRIQRRPLLAYTAMARSCSSAKVRLLHQAGASFTAADLLSAIDMLAPAAVTTLLPLVGRPVVDTSWPEMLDSGGYSYSCPFHRVLHTAVRCWCCCC